MIDLIKFCSQIFRLKPCCDFKNSFIRSELTFSESGRVFTNPPGLDKNFIFLTDVDLSFHFLTNSGYVYGEI